MEHAHRFSLAALAALLLATACSGAVVAERELLLRNTLDVTRPDEILAISLADLAVPVALEQKIVGVEVADESGKPIPCQLDRFSQLGGFRSEVAMEVSLRPYAVRCLKVRLLDSKRASTRDICRAQVKGKIVEVTTPVYSVKVTHGVTLTVRQPKITPPKKTEDEEFDDLFDDADDLDEGGGAESLLPAGEGPDVSAPFTEDGLPFAISGVQSALGRPRLTVWGGPVRAVVTLCTPGPWRVAKVVVPCAARQSFSFPRSGKRFFLDFALHLKGDVPRGRFAFGGLRVDSVNQPWQLIMGQRGKPPRVAPVKIILDNSKHIVLEPYQRGTFSHFWAQAVAKEAWAALVIDRTTSNFGVASDWDTGRQLLPTFLSISDNGAYANSVQPMVRFRALKAGTRGRLRAACYFGGKDDKPADGNRLNDCLNAPPAVPHRVVEPPPPLDMAQLRQLVAQKSVVAVVPDVEVADRTPLWDRLADRLGGTWRRSKGFLQYFNVMRGDHDPSLLIILVGEPGTNPLLDQFNRAHQAFSAYPVHEDRTTLALYEEEAKGTTLVVAGNAEKATALAVEQLLQGVGEVPPRPAISLSPHVWAAKMPQPWSGLRDHSAPFTALAYRNGRAEFLFLLRANREVANLKLTAPSGAVCRVVPWKFDAAGDDAPRVVPVHDAAFPEPPSRLRRDQVVAVWISLTIPRSAKPGVQKHTARIQYAGGERTIPLQASVLSIELPDKPKFGFSPMGLRKEGIMFYFGWDEADYYRYLPQLLRDRGRFGANTFPLEASGFRLSVDEKGHPSIDATEFKKELDAVRAAGCIDVLFISSLNYVANRDFRQIAARKKLADEYEAWEYVIPVMRQTLRELGVEDQIVCRHGDEIPDYDGWLPKARIIKRCGFRMSVAINGYGVFNKHLAVGTMGFWIPLYNFFLNRWGHPIADDDFIHFSKKFRDERQAAGEEIWPYVCGPGPYAWSTRPRSQARYLILDTYMKGADGLSYYGGTCWSHALSPAYRDERKAELFDTDCTFVTLFYPDYERNGILPSLRAGSFRIGHEDVSATQVVRVLAKQKGQFDRIEAKIQESYATIDMNASQEIFDAHRRTLDALYRGLVQ